ncbi:hypothetical protein K466DRAFT_446764, partial [Polyporus arcularius HHB13444]
NRVRLAILISPKPGLSADDCRSYWLNTHSEVFSSIAIVKRNLLNYEQMSSLTLYRGYVGDDPEIRASSVHGHGCLEAETMEKIAEVFHDQEYHHRIVV